MSGLGFNYTLYDKEKQQERIADAQHKAIKAQQIAEREAQLTPDVISYRDEYLKRTAAAAAVAAAKRKEEQFKAEMYKMFGNDYLFPSDLKEALRRKYGKTKLPRFIKLKPFVERDEYLYTSVIDTNTWEIYYPDPSNPNRYIKKPTPGFYNTIEYIMNLYYDLKEKMEPASELELAGGRRRYKRAQNKAKSSKKRINKNKRRTRSRK